MRIAFRPAEPQDFGYCAQLYFAGMEHSIRESKLAWMLTLPISGGAGR